VCAPVARRLQINVAPSQPKAKVSVKDKQTCYKHGCDFRKLTFLEHIMATKKKAAKGKGKKKA
jgi:hypothetical protein